MNCRIVQFESLPQAFDRQHCDVAAGHSGSDVSIGSQDRSLDPGHLLLILLSIAARLVEHEAEGKPAKQVRKVFPTVRIGRQRNLWIDRRLLVTINVNETRNGNPHRTSSS